MADVILSYRLQYEQQKHYTAVKLILHKFSITKKASAKMFSLAHKRTECSFQVRIVLFLYLKVMRISFKMALLTQR